MAKHERMMHSYAPYDTGNQREQEQQVRADVGNRDRDIIVIESSNRRGTHWLWIIALVIAVVAVVVAVWMNGVGSSLANLNQTANHTANAVTTQQSELSGMQAHLNAITNQLNQLQADMRTWLTNIKQALQHW